MQNFRSILGDVLKDLCSSKWSWAVFDLQTPEDFPRGMIHLCTVYLNPFSNGKFCTFYGLNSPRSMGHKLKNYCSILNQGLEAGISQASPMVCGVQMVRLSDCRGFPLAL